MPAHDARREAERVAHDDLGRPERAPAAPREARVDAHPPAAAADRQVEVVPAASSSETSPPGSADAPGADVHAHVERLLLDDAPRAERAA